MRKLMAIVLTGLIISSVVSCRSREKCPAYGYQHQVSAKKPA